MNGSASTHWLREKQGGVKGQVFYNCTGLLVLFVVMVLSVEKSCFRCSSEASDNPLLAETTDTASNHPTFSDRHRHSKGYDKTSRLLQELTHYRVQDSTQT